MKRFFSFPIALVGIACVLATSLLLLAYPELGAMFDSIGATRQGLVPSEGWHEYFLAIITASATMLAATIAVAAFAQRPRDGGQPANAGERMLTVLLVSSVVRLLLTPFVLFTASTILSLLMLIPHESVRHVQIACFGVAIAELLFFLIYHADQESMRAALKSSRTIVADASALKSERAQLIEELQPYLPESERVGRPTPRWLNDMTHELEHFHAPERLRIRINDHNRRVRVLQDETKLDPERSRSDIAFVTEIDRLAPRVVRSALAGVAIMAPILLSFATSPEWFAFVAFVISFSGIIYLVFALVGLMKANVARLLTEVGDAQGRPPDGSA